VTVRLQCSQSLSFLLESVEFCVGVFLLCSLERARAKSTQSTSLRALAHQAHRTTSAHKKLPRMTQAPHMAPPLPRGGEGCLEPE
jgi:hypothetical protein